MQTHTYLAVKSMFFKISVVLVIIGFGKKRNIKFFVLCAEVAICVCLLVVCGSLWSFAVGLWLFVVVCDHLLVVCGRLLVVCGRLWSFAGGLWSFVVAACFNNYLNGRILYYFL